MTEVALPIPLDSSEIIDIILAQARRRLEGLSPLQMNKQYGAFSVSFQHTIKLYGIGASEAPPIETLAWANDTHGKAIGEPELVIDAAVFASGAPNDDRIAHDLPLIVETSDGKGGQDASQGQGQG